MSVRVCPLCRVIVGEDRASMRQHLDRDHSTWEMAKFAWREDPAFAAAWWLGGFVLLTLAGATAVELILRLR